MVTKRKWEETREKRKIIEETLRDLGIVQNNIVNGILGVSSKSRNAYYMVSEECDKLNEISNISENAYVNITYLMGVVHHYLTMYEIASKLEKLRFLPCLTKTTDVSFLRPRPLEDIAIEEFLQMRDKAVGIRRYFEEQEGRYE